MVRPGLRRLMLFGLVVALALPVAAQAQDVTPGERFRLAGEVTGVVLDAQLMLVRTVRGEDWRIQVTDETEFRSPSGEVESLEDIEVGMRVAVSGLLTDDGALASTIAITTGEDSPRLQRAAGTISAVRPEVPTFELEGGDGESWTFLVTDEARFVSRQGTIQGVEDLEPGMLAAVVYHDRDQALVALRVVVGHEQDRPRMGIRLRGKVTAISATSITIEDREAESTTFLITDSTRIHKRGGGRIEVGDWAMVAGLMNDQGRPVAVLILAAPSKHDRPERPPVRRDRPQRQPRLEQPTALPD